MSKLIVITGAGTGIGRAIAQRFAVNGDHIVMVGRRKEKLDEACADIKKKSGNSNIEAYPVDLSEVSSSHAFSQYIAEKKIPVDSLICCAGSSPFNDGSDLASIASNN